VSTFCNVGMCIRAYVAEHATVRSMMSRSKRRHFSTRRSFRWWSTSRIWLYTPVALLEHAPNFILNWTKVDGVMESGAIRHKIPLFCTIDERRWHSAGISGISRPWQAQLTECKQGVKLISAVNLYTEIDEYQSRVLVVNSHWLELGLRLALAGGEVVH